MDSSYDTELEKLPQTYSKALVQNIDNLKSAITSASESSIIAVGSGGSYTIGSLLCNLHESHTGRVSRPTTPLEIIINPTLALNSPAFFISAEGKNKDILGALKQSCEQSPRSAYILCNREDSPLSLIAEENSEIKKLIFDLSEKDGYLATNSLLYTSILVIRAYSELNNPVSINSDLPENINHLLLMDGNISKEIDSKNDFFAKSAKREMLMIVYSPEFRAVAIDVESKVSESALMHCQIVDLRSFAHGRHLWLEKRPQDFAILGLIEPKLKRVWEDTVSLWPETILSDSFVFRNSTPQDLLAGIVVGMELIGAIAQHKKTDVGKPFVPEFGRSIHNLDICEHIVHQTDNQQYIVNKKRETLGGRWPLADKSHRLEIALNRVIDGFKDKVFRCVVFDYDGTLAHSHLRNLPPPNEITQEIVKMLESGVIIGIASGRGDSLYKIFRDVLPEANWQNMILGLYNCGYIVKLSDDLSPPGLESELLNHVTRISQSLKESGAPINVIKKTSPYQVSIRLNEGTNPDEMWFVLVDSFRRAGLSNPTVLRSKHSIDVLGDNVSKSYLIANLIKEKNLHPYDILTVGDQGDWPGNDSSLLEHKYSLSVDSPSRHLDRGWKLAPQSKRDVSATMFYLDNMTCNNGSVNVNIEDICINDER